MTLKVVVLISGNGSNLQAIIDAMQKDSLPIEIAAVISSDPEAYGLQRAAKARIPFETVRAKDYHDRPSYDLALAEMINLYRPDLIILAGFMRILGNDFLKIFKNKIINIHPSLLPKYPGLHTHQQAIADGELEHGCSIHIVNGNLDAGPLIAQASVKISSQETVASLKNKVHKAEHFLYPTVIKWFAEGRIQVRDEQVFLDGILIPAYGLRFAVDGVA